MRVPPSLYSPIERTVILFYLLLLFTVVPLTELFILVQLGIRLGPLPTVALVLLTGIVGASLARAQGALVLWRIREQLQRHEMPADSILDGLLILVAGGLLITPGVVTDLVGFSLLVPALRTAYKRLLTKWFRRRIQIQASSFRERARSRFEEESGARDRIIDVEVMETRTHDEADGERANDR